MDKLVMERIQKYAEKLGRDINTELQQIKTELQQLHPNWSEEQLTNRALSRLFIRYRRELQSPALWFQGYIIGMTPVSNVVAKMRQEAINLYQKDPIRAIDLGYVNPSGQPLNRNTGQVLPEHLFLKNIYLIAKQLNTNEPYRFYSLLCGEFGNKYLLTPPLYQLLKFRANVSGKQSGYIQQLNASITTEFEILPNIQEVNLLQLIQKVCEKFYIPLKSIEEWHKLHQDNPRRVMLTEGDVVDIRQGQKGMVVFLYDEGLPETDATGRLYNVPVFFDNYISKYVDFDAESRVITIGRTNYGQRTDITTQQVVSRLTISGYGIIAIPEYKVPLKERTLPSTEMKPPEEELW